MLGHRDPVGLRPDLRLRRAQTRGRFRTCWSSPGPRPRQSRPRSTTCAGRAAEHVRRRRPDARRPAVPDHRGALARTRPCCVPPIPTCHRRWPPWSACCRPTPSRHVIAGWGRRNRSTAADETFGPCVSAGADAACSHDRRYRTTGPHPHARRHRRAPGRSDRQPPGCRAEDPLAAPRPPKLGSWSCSPGTAWACTHIGRTITTCGCSTDTPGSSTRWLARDRSCTSPAASGR